jgi:hypothetical protein
VRVIAAHYSQAMGKRQYRKGLRTDIWPGFPHVSDSAIQRRVGGSGQKMTTTDRFQRPSSPDVSFRFKNEELNVPSLFQITTIAEFHKNFAQHIKLHLTI